MQRNPLNRNQKLYFLPQYQGMPVQQREGGLIENYLSRLQRVIDTALDDYPRVFAFRVDLRFPIAFRFLQLDLVEVGNAAITKFLASFKAKVSHNRFRLKKTNPCAHDSVVRYVWARELSQEGVPHYHVAFLLNKDAFFTVGTYELGRENIYNRLCQAWASALGIDVSLAQGLVHIPENAGYSLFRHDPAGQADFFHRASYLCKQSSKQFGDGQHGFGASRG